MGGWIALAILLLLAAVFWLWVRFIFLYDEEGLRVLLRIGPVRLTLYPRKRGKVRPGRYSRATLAKQEAKAERKRLKKAEKDRKKTVKKGKAATETKKQEKKSFSDVRGLVDLIRKLVFTVFSRFFRYLRVDVAKLNIVVATEDAAKTAVLFGAVTAAVSNLCELLENTIHFAAGKNSEISVRADFLRERTEAEIHISLRMRAWHFLAIAFGAAITFLKEKVFKK